MIKNYLLTALRNMRNNRYYTTINIVGLTFGIVSALFIYLFIQDELSFDKFHSKADRMYRVTLSGSLGEQKIHTAVTSPPMAETLVNDFPEVEHATRIYRLDKEVMRYKETLFTEEKVFFADSNFFKVFDFTLIKGNPETALKEPHTLVLNESTAKKYFGDEDPLGKTFEVGDYRSNYKVAGVVADPLHNSHFNFDVLYSMSTLEYASSNNWISNSFYTYIVLHEGSDPEVLEAKFPAMVKKYVGPDVERFMGMTIDEMFAKGNEYGYTLQPFLDIHLYSDVQDDIAPQGDISYIVILSLVASFIIILACINFINLSTARSANRAKEVGIRKTIGSSKGQLVGQFLTESTLLTLFATLLALAVAVLLLPNFNHLVSKEFSINHLFTLQIILFCLGAVLLIGFFSGSYPAFYMTKFRPAEVLKGKIRSGFKRSGFRNGLVVLQFTISSILLICTVLVYQQIEFLQNKNLGFERENIVVISNGNRLGNKIITYKNAIVQHNDVINAAVSTIVPPGVNNNSPFRGADDTDHLMGFYGADYEHLQTLGIKIKEGRNFSRDVPSDSTAILINEAAARVLGWENPVGEEITQGATDYKLKVIGVVENFNFESLKDEIRPLIIGLRTTGSKMAVRIDGGEIPATLDMLEKEWKATAPDEPFEYAFLDDNFNELFNNEQRLSKIFTLFTGLSFIIACLGLLGLAAYTAEQKTKEIGIRKIMGASVGNILLLLSNEFAKLILIAFALAIPVAYYLGSEWLQNFAYHIGISYWYFVLPLLLVILVGLITINLQIAKTAMSKPVNTLRYE